MVMTTFSFDESTWNQLKGKLRQKYGQLTDDDVQFAEGKGEELLGRLQQKLGLGADALQAVLGELCAPGVVHQKVQQAKDKAAEIAEDIKIRASATAAELKDYAGESYEQVTRKARSLHEDGEEYVRQNPRPAVLTALAAGFVVGLLIRR